jgi:hypothetical protein
MAGRYRNISDASGEMEGLWRRPAKEIAEEYERPGAVIAVRDE